MYVCVCNGHRSQDIERTARERKLTCARAIYDALGGPVCCGACVDFAQELVDDVHAGGRTPCGLPQRRLIAAE